MNTLHLARLVVALGLLAPLTAPIANDNSNSYEQHNLVSDGFGSADHTDKNLVNGWGVAFNPNGFVWVADNKTGVSTLYDGLGNPQSLVVRIPVAQGNSGTGSPTGIVFNGSTEFQLQGSGSVFLFATLDGTISAWVPGVNFNQALIAANNSSSGAVYTGLAITNNASGNMLFAADNANNKVDMYDGTFTWKGSFTDTTVPAGF